MLVLDSSFLVLFTTAIRNTWGVLPSRWRCPKLLRPISERFRTVPPAEAWEVVPG